jgi:hypothetical protein
VNGFLREEKAGSQQKCKEEYDSVWSHDLITTGALPPFQRCGAGVSPAVAGASRSRAQAG